MAITGNFKGTTQPDFRIGKKGAKIFGTDVLPAANVSNQGDLWIDAANNLVQVYTSGSEWVDLNTLTSLEILSDTTIAALADNDILVYDSVAGAWVNESDISVNTLAINEVTVIDSDGEWVGNIAGLQGTQGIQGITGDTGSQGIQGITGAQGTTGTQGITGNQGITGAQGTQASQGIQGAEGQQGTTGEQGVTGAQGTQGIQGPSNTVGSYLHTQGSASTTWTVNHNLGEQYVVVEVIDSNGESFLGKYDYPVIDYVNSSQLTVTFTSAQSGFVAAALGTQGVQGTTGLQGTTGEQGIQGNQGIQGTQASQGIQGAEGQQGTTGEQGVTGAQGIQGIQGTQASQGIQGAEGQQGTQGTEGTDGQQGSQGIQGITGAQGTDGQQGIQGVQGVQGTEGQQGITGDQGIQGTTGEQGIQGVTGNQGITGAQGIQGIQGTTGEQGIQGVTGNQGTTGPSTTINATDDTSQNATHYPVFVAAAGSNQTAEVSTTKFTFNPSTGTITAVSKSFLIDHPSKPDYKLQYGSLEGPENGVYVRGRLTNESVIVLPDYWVDLVDQDTVTVELTSVGQYQKLYVDSITESMIVVGSESTLSVNCFYTVYGERKDIEKLKVEYPNGNNLQ